MKRCLLAMVILLGGSGAQAAGSPPVFPAWERLLLARDSGGGELAALARRGMGGDDRQGHRFTIQSDLDLILHRREGEQRHDYHAHAQRLTWFRRGDNHWLNCDLIRNRTELRQRNIYSTDDRLLADGVGDLIRLTAGAESDGLGIQVGLGRARRETTLDAILMKRLGPSLIQMELATEEFGWDLEQSFADRRFHFAFPLHGERLSLGYISGHRHIPSLRLHGEELRCNRRRGEGDFNRLAAERKGAALSWSPGGKWPAITLDHVEGWVSMRMFADGVSYLYLPRLEHRARAVAVTGRLPGGIRLLLGGREQKVSSTGGYAEPWPFIVWAIFTNDRFGIDLLHYRLRVWSTGLGRQFKLGSAHELDLNLTHLRLSGGGFVDWNQRIWTLPPFFFRLERERVILPLPARQGIRLDLNLRSRVSSTWRVALRLRQLLPLDDLLNGDGGGTPPSPPPAAGDHEKFTFGGMYVTLRIDHELR